MQPTGYMTLRAVGRDSTGLSKQSESPFPWCISYRMPRGGLHNRSHAGSAVAVHQVVGRKTKLATPTRPPRSNPHRGPVRQPKGRDFRYAGRDCWSCDMLSGGMAGPREDCGTFFTKAASYPRVPLSTKARRIADREPTDFRTDGRGQDSRGVPRPAVRAMDEKVVTYCY